MYDDSARRDRSFDQRTCWTSVEKIDVSMKMENKVFCKPVAAKFCL